LSQFVLIAS